jgi:OmpA-OmpF porin, OOP family
MRYYGSILTGLAALTLLGPVPAAAECDDLGARFRAAAADGDFGAMQQVHDAALRNSGCSAGLRMELGRVIAVGLTQAAQQLAGSGASAETVETTLRRALGYARPWPALAMLGDVERDRRNFPEATRFYEEALTVIGDEVATPQAPDPGIIRHIFQQASQARLLADDFVERPRTRTGEPGGLALPEIRGFVIEKVALPVTFDTGSVELTEAGRKATEEMALMVRGEQLAGITIVGHADARGNADYNRDLSRRRAERIAALLRERGYTGQIQTIGKGADEPFAVDDPRRLSREERYQLDRRVELVRN